MQVSNSYTRHVKPPLVLLELQRKPIGIFSFPQRSVSAFACDLYNCKCPTPTPGMSKPPLVLLELQHHSVAEQGLLSKLSNN